MRIPLQSYSIITGGPERFKKLIGQSYAVGIILRVKSGHHMPVEQLPGQELSCTGRGSKPQLGWPAICLSVQCCQVKMSSGHSSSASSRDRYCRQSAWWKCWCNLCPPCHAQQHYRHGSCRAEDLTGYPQHSLKGCSADRSPLHRLLVRYLRLRSRQC